MNIYKRIERFKRNELGRLLAQCTEAQIEFFKRIFPTADSVKIAESSLITAIQVCERTILKIKGERRTMKKRRLSPFDFFIYYDYKKNRIILIKKDVAINKIWEYWHYDGIDVWWTKGIHIHEHWILLDRLPEGTL